MVVVASIIVMTVRLVKKLIYHLINRVVLALFFGVGFMTVVCTYKGACLTLYTWPAYVLLLLFLGLGWGLYEFLIIK